MRVKKKTCRRKENQRRRSTTRRRTTRTTTRTTRRGGAASDKKDSKARSKPKVKKGKGKQKSSTEEDSCGHRYVPRPFGFDRMVFEVPGRESTHNFDMDAFMKSFNKSSFKVHTSSTTNLFGNYDSKCIKSAKEK